MIKVKLISYKDNIAEYLCTPDRNTQENFTIKINTKENKTEYSSNEDYFYNGYISHARRIVMESLREHQTLVEEAETSWY